jgi:uncharacterized membrane protein HdeD (DUF308 family)
MKYLLKHLGLLLILMGAFLIIVPYFTHHQTNNLLLMGWLLIFLGFISYSFIHKKTD